MKKLIIPILALILSGSFYFFVKNNVSNDNTGSETVTQTNNNAISTTDVSTQSVADKNKNKSNKEEKQKAIINTTTGENVPEGFYDEVLADGYTYNNPKPIPDSWIIEPAGDGYPATIDNIKLSDSWVVPLNGKIYRVNTNNHYDIKGNNYRQLYIITKKQNLNKTDFSEWFRERSDLNFMFVDVNEERGHYEILLTDGNIQNAMNLKKHISSEGFYIGYSGPITLPRFIGTKEEINFNQSFFQLIAE